MKKCLLILVATVLLVSLAVSCAKPAPTPTPKPVAPAATAAPTVAAKAAAPTPVPPAPTTPARVWKLKTQTYAAKSLDPQWVSPNKLADMIREATGGQVDFVTAAMGELVPTQEIYSAVGKGVIDAGVTIDAYIAGMHPEFEWAKNPAIISSAEDFYKSLDGGVKNILVSQVAKDNVKAAVLWDMHDIVVHALRDKQIKTLDDFKGRKIRGFGGICDEFLKAVQAGIVVMPMTEVYTAAQTGVIDGMATGLPGYMSMKGYEVTPYITWAKGASGSFTMMLMVNMDIWNKIPADLQAKVAQAEKDFWKWQVNYMNSYLDESRKFFTDHGATVYVLPAEESARWRDLFNKVGVPWFTSKSGDVGKQILGIIEKTLNKKIL